MAGEYRDDGAGQQRIQTYYHEPDELRYQGLGRDYPYGAQDGYSYGSDSYYGPDYHWNQSHSTWGTAGYSQEAYYSQDYGPGYDYDRSWETNGYAQSQTASSQPQPKPPPRRQQYKQPKKRHRSPSPSYLTMTLDLSVHTEPAPRKLLILDLNGTLLLRSPPRFRIQGSDSRKRNVRPRPYLTSFREYLFHPTTRSWLDVMIWSSAQPHSVQDMLEHCFPAPEGAEYTANECFLAVWARDTLGLSATDYSRKTQTFKDLRKPWRQLAPAADAASTALRTQHSANTTLLLDDSPRKAELQPWNHVCVPEYDRAAHARSKASLADTQDEDAVPPAGMDSVLLAVIGILEALRCESNVAAWIRAGGLCDRSVRAAEPDARASSVVVLPTEATPEHARDEDGDDAKESEPPKEARTALDGRPSIEPSPKHASDEEGDDFKESGSPKEARTALGTEPSTASSRKHARDEEGDDAKELGPSKRARKRRARAKRKSGPPLDKNASAGISSPATPPPALPLPPVPSPSPARPIAHPPPPAPLVVNPPSPISPVARVSSSAISTPSSAVPQPVPSLDTAPESTHTSLWFEDAPTLARWVARGREVLKERGIGEVVGVGVDGGNSGSE